jgi:hypothetical protein
MYLANVKKLNMNEEAQEWMDRHYEENERMYDVMAHADPDEE